MEEQAFQPDQGHNPDKSAGEENRKCPVPGEEVGPGREKKIKPEEGGQLGEEAGRPWAPGILGIRL